MNISNIVTKAIGIAGLGMVLYDSHYAGGIESKAYQKKCNTNNVTETFMETMSLDRPSIVQAKMKNRYLKFKMDENFTDFFEGIIGYAKGFGSMLVNNVVPFGLALGTVATKGIASKAFGLGLLGYGVVYLLHDVMGLVNPSKLQRIDL